VFKIISIILFFIISLNAYETEDKLKVVIVGKVAKYVTYKDNNLTNFTITVLNNPFGNLFDSVYYNKKIKSKPVKINYIKNIDDLNNTDILYISNVDNEELSNIIQKTNGKNILTVSDTRGFAQRGGVLQLYFVSQKLKLKINLNSAKEQSLKIKSTLLRISDVVEGDQP